MTDMTQEEADALDELELTGLATDLQVLLERAETIFTEHERRRNDAKAKRATPPPQDAEAYLAEKMLDAFGPPEDIYFIRNMAKGFAESRPEPEDPNSFDAQCDRAHEAWRDRDD